MKKYIILSLMMLLATASFCQSKMPDETKIKGNNAKFTAIVKDALLKGRIDQGRGAYSINVPKSIRISYDDFRRNMRYNNLVVIKNGNLTTKAMIKFGNRVPAIRSAEFMPENEIGYYLARVQSDKLQKGKAYIVLGGSSKAVDVEWSGRVANGMIEGSGTGVAMLENGQHYVISGKYINGIANGNCTVTQVTANVEDGMLDPSKMITKDKSYMVSDFINGYARYYKDDKWGFIDESAKVVVQPKYKKIVSSFDSDGEAIVLNDQDEEIKIDKHGSELGYSDHQNEIFAEARRKAELEEQERQRKAAEEARQRAEQEEKARIAAANAEKRRIDEIRNAKEGDRIVYCEDWVHTETNTFLWFTLSERRDAYTMKVICFVEKNVDNGERLQVRVGAVESSDKRYYNTPIIEGIRYEKGDVIWIRPLENTGWWME